MRCALVTGVQTCALPISNLATVTRSGLEEMRRLERAESKRHVENRHVAQRARIVGGHAARQIDRDGAPRLARQGPEAIGQCGEIGRESWRERVVQYV